MKTIKLPIHLSENDSIFILNMQKQQNNVIRYIYNRFKENQNITQKELTILVNNMNNINIGSWLKQSGIVKAKTIFKTNNQKNIIFGGKNLFIQRCQNKITKKDFQLQKLLPLYIEGEKIQKGNRLFSLDIIENNSIIFKVDKNNHIIIKLPKLRKNYKKELYLLQELSNFKMLPYTIAISMEYIFITFDEAKLYLNKQSNKIKDRIMSLDLNPNYIGYSIIDWTNNNYTILLSGVIDLKQINDKEFLFKQQKLNSSNKKRIQLNNQRKHEICEIGNKLIDIAIHNKVNVFSVEKLKIISKDNKLGKKFNKLVNNNWNRNILYNILKKRCNINDILFLDIAPEYSSFIGNIVYSDYPDMIAASIEISRRSYQFYHQYIIKDFTKQKNIIFPEFSWNLIRKPLEGFSDEMKRNFNSWIDLYNYLKKSKVRYRFSFSDFLQKESVRVFKSKIIKNKVIFYSVK